MLRSWKSLLGFRVDADGGTLGKLHDLRCDDRRWTVHSLAVETVGEWLPRSLWIPIEAVRSIDPSTESIDLSWSRERLSRLPEPANWPYVWSGAGAWGLAPLPAGLAQLPQPSPAEASIRYFGELAGFGIEARDGHFGHVMDLLFEENPWKVRYLVIDTVNWWPSKHVLIDPRWIQDIHWNDRRIHLPIHADDIKSAPPYERGGPLSRKDEARLYEHYGRVPYWVSESGEVAGPGLRSEPMAQRDRVTFRLKRGRKRPGSEGA